MSIRRLLYGLKRQWGKNFDYVQILTSEANSVTGDFEIHRKIVRFPAVLLPQSQIRKFIQDIGYLAANKNFTYGGYNDFNTLSIVILKSDLPSDFNPDLNGYINYNHKRYERLRFENFTEEAYMLVVQGVEGARPYQTIPVAAYNNLQIQSRASYELN